MTMAFSQFTIDQGVCFNPKNLPKAGGGSESLRLPACPILTFDMALLHLLSTATLALLLVILSTVLAPGYDLSHSMHHDPAAGSPRDSYDMGMGKGGSGGLVLWDLAMAPVDAGDGGERERLHVERYGATEGDEVGGSGSSGAAESARVPAVPVYDKFAKGRVSSYSVLLACSLGVVASTGMLAGGDATGGSPFIIVVAALSTIFAAGW